CVNIIPGLTSVFKWEGMIKKEQETLIMIKITKDQYGALEQEILKSHPYEVHEIIAFELAAGYDAYLNWIATGSTQHEE
ncbi:MAG: divalent-cation tolerance protein CutA, partial [Calditrichaeota bacterium]|nr:divalent-cation tolerance protein CutA [Calditrichota bacterium]